MTILILILSVIVLAIVILIILAKYEAFEAVPLLKAIKRNRTEEALALLRQGADVNLTIELEETPLICAAFAGNLEVAKVLVEAGAGVNAQSIPTRFSALLWAALKGYTEIVRLLIEAGADVNSINKRGESALVLFLHTQQYETAAAFFDDLMLAGVDIHATNAEGSSALTSAVTAALREQAKGSHPLLNVIRRLVKAGADINLALAIANGAYAPEFFDKHKREIINILSGG
jgi:ankyrin repeat protein